MTRPVLWALGLVAAGLVAVIGAQVVTFGNSEVPDLAAPRRLPLPAQAQPRTGEARGEELMARALARPLFNADRRPTPGEGAAAARAAPAEPPRLAGILITAEGRQAIFAAGDRSIVVREGGSIGAFLVTGISGEQVSVNGPTGPRILRPSFLPGGPEGAGTAGSRSAAGTDAAFNANPAPSGLDIIRNAARQAGLPPPGTSLPLPVPGVEQTGVAAVPAPARPQGPQSR
jgi:hypothetical protein